jgi:hypothetical protein
MQDRFLVVYGDHDRDRRRRARLLQGAALSYDDISPSSQGAEYRVRSAKLDPKRTERCG